MERFVPTLAGFNQGIPAMSRAAQEASASAFSGLSNQLAEVSTLSNKIAVEQAKLTGTTAGVQAGIAAEEGGQSLPEFTASLPSGNSVQAQAFRDAAATQFMSSTVISFDATIDQLSRQYRNDPMGFATAAGAAQRAIVSESPVEVQSELRKSTDRNVRATLGKIYSQAADAAVKESERGFQLMTDHLRQKVTQARFENNQALYNEAVSEMTVAYRASVGKQLTPEVAEMRLQNDLAQAERDAVVLQATVSKNPFQVLRDNGMFSPETVADAISRHTQYQSVVDAQRNRQDRENREKRDGMMNAAYSAVIEDPTSFDPTGLAKLTQDMLDLGSDVDEVNTFRTRMYSLAAGAEQVTLPHIKRQMEEYLDEANPEAAAFFQSNEMYFSPADKVAYDRRLRNMTSDALRSDRVKDALSRYYAENNLNPFPPEVVRASTNSDALAAHNARVSEQRASLEADLARAISAGQTTVDEVESFLTQRSLQRQNPEDAFRRATVDRITLGRPREAKAGVESLFNNGYTASVMGGINSSGRRTFETVTIPPLTESNLDEVADKMRRLLQGGARNLPFSKEDVVNLEREIEARDSAAGR